MVLGVVDAASMVVGDANALIEGVEEGEQPVFGGEQQV
jgi:hypothetical protein